jgi:hypothetical protein
VPGAPTHTAIAGRVVARYTPRMRPPIVCSAVLLALALTGCARTRHPGDWAAVREVTPAPLGQRAATDPTVATDTAGHVALTFVTRDNEGARDLWVTVSRDGGASFTAPQRLDPVEGLVSSYSESRPLAVWGPGGRLAVAWSRLRSDSGLTSDLVVRSSADQGATFGPPVVVNDDSLETGLFHGFPALAYLGDGALFAAWMEGGTGSGDEGAGSLVSATSRDGGITWSANTVVSDSLCPCCRSCALAFDGGRVALLWRGAASNVRDPLMAFSTDDGATFGPARPLGSDGWVLEACPSDGPVMSANDDAGVAAWSTGVAPAGLRLAPWRFGMGVTGLARPLLDSLAQAAHPHVAPLGASTLVVAQGLPAGDSVSVIAARVLDPDGSLTPWTFLGAGARDAWVAPLGRGAALVAWVEGDRPRSRVRLARLERRPR